MSLEIVAIPALKDNYIWLGVNAELGQAFVVDPGEAAPVLEYLESQDLALAAILATHKHADHTGGILELLDAYPDTPVYAHEKENVTGTTHFVADGDEFKLFMWPIPFTVLFIPGHTFGHVAYYAAPALFCGDTLFSAGCGRVFEGTPAQMFASLEKLAALPDDTEIYCGHEYTLNNLRFAMMAEPENRNIMQRYLDIEKLCEHGEPSLPSTMKIERLTNPFLRCKQRAQLSGKDPVVIFQQLREWKNRF